RVAVGEVLDPQQRRVQLGLGEHRGWNGSGVPGIAGSGAAGADQAQRGHEGKCGESAHNHATILPTVAGMARNVGCHAPPSDAPEPPRGRGGGSRCAYAGTLHMAENAAASPASQRSTSAAFRSSASTAGGRCTSPRRTSTTTAIPPGNTCSMYRFIRWNVASTASAAGGSGSKYSRTASARPSSYRSASCGLIFTGNTP